MMSVVNEWELSESSAIIYCASIREFNRKDYPFYLSVLTTQMKQLGGSGRGGIYKTLLGAKIGFGIHFVAGLKWIKKEFQR